MSLELVIDVPERRLLEAAARAHTLHGYQAIDSASIAAESGLSVAEFERRFDSPLDCLVEAQQLALADLKERLDEACAAEREWPVRVIAAVAAGLEFAAAEPDLALLLAPSSQLLNPLLGAGVWETTDHLAGQLRAGSERHLGRQDSPAIFERILIGGIQGLIAAELRGGRADELPAMRDEIAATILVPSLGSPATARFLGHYRDL